MQSGMVWEGKLTLGGICLHANICNLSSGFLETDYMSFLKRPGMQGENMRQDMFSQNTVLLCKRNYYFFSENLFLVIHAFCETS